MIKEVRQIIDEVGMNGYQAALVKSLATKTGAEEKKIGDIISRLHRDAPKFDRLLRRTFYK